MLTDYATAVPDAAPVVVRTPVVVESQQSEADLYLPLLKARLVLSEVDYDAALLPLLAEAIDQVEQYTRLCLQPTDVTVRFASYNGEPMPFGPVWAEPTPTLTATRIGSSIRFNNQTAGQLDTGAFPVVLAQFRYGTIAYRSGYSLVSANPYPVPAGLIGAVLTHAADSFRNGNVTGGMNSLAWKRLAGPYRRFD